MPNQRDLINKRRERDRKKENIRPRFRSVIVTATGERTLGGDPWADENNKIVWHQLFGSGGVGRAKCVAITNPEVGLGVEVSRVDDRLAEWEVIGPDPFLRLTATDNRNYGPTGANDLQPGGRLMMWLYSKAILPLATFPNTTGLMVNVVGGDYPYNGTRKTLSNQFNIALTQNPNPGEHYYAGLYINSANTIQVVYGASVSTASEPPEPTWPAGAFRLSVVRVNDTQTAITYASDESASNDIFDRRMLWSDEDSGVGNEDLIRIRTFN